MKVNVIVTRVRSAIDELMVNDTEFINASKDEENLTLLIIDKIPYALTYVIANAPDEMLDADLAEGLSTTDLQTFSITEDMTAKVRIPSDVLRVVSARLSSWSFSPYPESEHSEVWLMQ